MKMPVIKVIFGLKNFWLILFTLSFLLLPIKTSATDPTNRMDFDFAVDSSCRCRNADIAVYREGGRNPTTGEIRSTRTYETSYWYYLNINSEATGAFPWGRTLDVPIPADHNGDGITDPAIFRWFDPTVAPFDNNQIWIPGFDTRGFGNASGRKMARNFVLETGKTPQKAEIGEFQRVNVGSPENPNYKYTFYHEDVAGGLTVRDTSIGFTGVFTQVPVPDDYLFDNGSEGKSEVAVFNTKAGCYYVWAEYNTPEASKIEKCLDSNSSSTTNYVPAPGDYDGDGKTDYAGIMAGTNQWIIKFSSNIPTITTTFGTADSKPVVADYDGDGKADLAVVSSISGNWQWTIQKSSTCSGVATSCQSPYIVSYGFDTDVPLEMPFFYDPWY